MGLLTVKCNKRGSQTKIKHHCMTTCDINRFGPSTRSESNPPDVLFEEPKQQNFCVVRYFRTLRKDRFNYYWQPRLCQLARPAVACCGLCWTTVPYCCSQVCLRLSCLHPPVSSLLVTRSAVTVVQLVWGAATRCQQTLIYRQHGSIDMNSSRTCSQPHVVSYVTRVNTM